MSVIGNVAFVVEIFTAAFTFERFAALNSVATIAFLLVLLNFTQFVDQFKISSILQLINGIFSDLQKLLKCFNGIARLISSLLARLSSLISPIFHIMIDLKSKGFGPK